MKKFSLFALAAAGLLLGACSSEKDEIAEPNNLYGIVEGESSWLAVGISMPGDAITRANEDLTDGLETEFTVKSGTLYLFKGANEDDAVFFQLFPITAAFSNETDDNVPGGNTLVTNPTSDGYGEITSTSARMVQEIRNPNLGVSDKLYAYVILNDDGNETGIAATANTTTGAQFKKQQLKAIGIADETLGYGAIGSDGLVMTSVPISTVAGGESAPASANILTFTEIDKSAIYKTKAEAEAKDAQSACIYVERAAVKVEVDVDKEFGIQLDGQTSTTLIAAADVTWALGNVNHGGTGGVGYYNTRQVDTDWLPYNNAATTPAYLRWRMVGRTPFFNADHTPNPAFRTYFGYDPNYSGTGAIPQDANTGLINAQLTDAQYTLKSEDVTYTYENTFDENCQIFRNTTYVGVKAKINPQDFYTIEGQPNTMLASTADIKAVVTTRMRDFINQQKALIQTDISADLGKATAADGRTISVGVTRVSFDIDVTVTPGTYNANTGELPYTVALALTNIKTNGAAASAADEAAIKAIANPYLNPTGGIAVPANSKVYQYKGGVSYYSVRIKHFGDVETPWSGPGEAYDVYQAAAPTVCIYPANATQTIDGVTTVYGENYAHAWLGRWGVVRNNWYVIKLKKIEGIGSPVPEDFSGEAGNTPDDNPPTSYFISAEVHILPWVKRFQEETL